MIVKQSFPLINSFDMPKVIKQRAKREKERLGFINSFGLITT